MEAHTFYELSVKHHNRTAMPLNCVCDCDIQNTENCSRHTAIAIQRSYHCHRHHHPLGEIVLFIICMFQTCHAGHAVSPESYFSWCKAYGEEQHEPDGVRCCHFRTNFSCSACRTMWSKFNVCQVRTAAFKWNALSSQTWIMNIAINVWFTNVRTILLLSRRPRNLWPFYVCTALRVWVCVCFHK